MNRSTDESMGPEKLARTRTFALVIVALHLVILLVNAGTTTVWEDEANGIFLGGRPLGEIIELMSLNFHEDPPLHNVLLHCWIPVAGFSPWLLRLQSVIFWVLGLVGIFVAGRRLGGERIGWCSLIAASLMPYHWLFPAAVRWYSFFACVTVWNFVCFLSLREQAENGVDGPARWRTLLPAGAGYALTGAAMWYTNYIAPGIFFCHLVICLAWSRQRVLLAGRLAGCWVVITFLYLPWLPTFLRQLFISTKTFSGRTPLLVKVPFSLYVTWAGELSTPFAWWISIPAAVAAVAAAGLILIRFRLCRLPLVIFSIMVLALCVSGTIGVKRMLIVSPFLAMCLGLSLAGRPDRAARWWARLRWTFAVCATIALTGSLVNMVRHEGWSTYRWFDPVEPVLQTLKSRQPRALLLTNSNVVFFYLHDQFGEMAAKGKFRVNTSQYDPRAVLYPLEGCGKRDFEEAIGEVDRVVYVHHSPYGLFSNVRAELDGKLASHGFRAVRTESFLQMAPLFLRYHHRLRTAGSEDHDSKRVVVAHFAREKAMSSAAVLSDGKVR